MVAAVPAYVADHSSVDYWSDFAEPVYAAVLPLSYVVPAAGDVYVRPEPVSDAGYSDSCVAVPDVVVPVEFYDDPVLFADDVPVPSYAAEYFAPFQFQPLTLLFIFPALPVIAAVLIITIVITSIATVITSVIITIIRKATQPTAKAKNAVAKDTVIIFIAISYLLVYRLLHQSRKSAVKISLKLSMTSD